MLKTLNQQINLLTRRQQEVIYLRFFESMDNEAIAQVMGISRPAVANLLYRTIQELKDRPLNETLVRSSCFARTIRRPLAGRNCKNDIALPTGRRPANKKSRR